MSRIQVLRPDQLSNAQRQVYDGITGGRRSEATAAGSLTKPDGGLVGPFNAFLYSPEVGLRVQALGEALRFSNSLPNQLLEIAVLMTAFEWKAQFEWWAHERLARRAGLDEEVITALKAGQRPAFEDEKAAAVYDFSREMLDTRRVGDATYNRAIELLGEQQVVDLISLLGYYGLVAMTLNAFAVPVPEGEALPFDE